MKDRPSITIHFTPGPVTGMLEEMTASYTAWSKETVNVENNRIYMPTAIGSGFIECRQLFDGMYCIASDVTYAHSVIMGSPSLAEERYYIIGCRYGYQQSYITHSAGTGKNLRIDGDSIFVHSTQLGSSFSFPANQRHRAFIIIVSRQFALEELRLTNYPSMHPLVQDFINDHPFSNVAPLPLITQHRIDQVFEQLDSEGHAGFIHRSAMISASYYLMNQWYLQFFNGDDQHGPFYHSNLHEVLKVKELYVSDFESPPMTVEELARMCNMSVTKFKSLFKSLFGMSCYQYYQAQRMEYAKELLSKHQYPVKEVAYLTGFQNTANFTRSFKKAYDILPRDFQKKSKFQSQNPK
jgi:AraC-like DNA-binding protein